MDNAALRDDVLEKLQLLPVTSRPMFGGYGLYLDGPPARRFFAVISDGVLYFRTDVESRAAYIEQGSQPLQPKHRPRGPKTVDRNFSVPANVLADAATLREWAIRAAAAKR